MTCSPGGLPLSLAVLLAIAPLSCQEVRADPPRAVPIAAAPPPAAASPRAAPPPAPTDALQALARRRASLREDLLAARSDAARRAVRKRAAALLERSLVDAVLPRWDGTPWSFSGTSTTPGQGSIACGYFVSTTLLEAGLHVERARLAQQPSEDIIKSLAPGAAITRFSDVPVDQFKAAIAAQGDGLYVVGLDIHVGYLIVRGGDVLFHHASYVGPAKVVREDASTSSPLVASRYRVVGKLFTDDTLVDAWLADAPIATRVRPPKKATR